MYVCETLGTREIKREGIVLCSAADLWILVITLQREVG